MTSASLPASGPMASRTPPNHADGADHEISPGEIAIGVILGRTSEFFDYFVFAIAAIVCTTVSSAGCEASSCRKERSILSLSTGSRRR